MLYNQLRPSKMCTSCGLFRKVPMSWAAMENFYDANVIYQHFQGKPLDNPSKQQCSELHLRNKLHFSDIHRSMNAMGHAQSKWHINFARDPLRSYLWTQLVTYKVSDTLLILRWMSVEWNSSLISTFYFYIVCVQYLWSFNVNTCIVKHAVKKSYKPMCLVITFISRPHGVTSIKCYIGKSTISFISDVTHVYIRNSSANSVNQTSDVSRWISWWRNGKPCQHHNKFKWQRN